jgi:hypothetical protein
MIEFQKAPVLAPADDLTLLIKQEHSSVNEQAELRARLDELDKNHRGALSFYAPAEVSAAITLGLIVGFILTTQAGYSSTFMALTNFFVPVSIACIGAATYGMFASLRKERREAKEERALLKQRLGIEPKETK